MDHLFACLQAIALCCAGVIFVLPLRKRKNWPAWIPLCLILLAMILVAGTPGSYSWLYGTCPLLYGTLLLLVSRCTEMSLAGSCYCAIWSVLAGETLMEILLALKLFQTGKATLGAGDLLPAVLIGAVFFLLIAKTISRWMPQKDVYQIGPRQLASAFALGILFMVASWLLQETDSPRAMVRLILFCQFYCVSLLYVQTELFKKSRMQKDLNAMNFLYDREQQQYASAKRNVGIVSEKCRQLEEKIAAMQEYIPEEARMEHVEAVQEAMRSVDVMVHSGNDALDIVLTEKKLLAEHYGVEIDSVADGSLLSFMEPVDIYALFSCALDNAIGSVKKYPENTGMLIDVLVHSAQGFVVIHIVSSLREERKETVHRRWSGLRGYGLEMVRMTAEKYRGLLSVDTDSRSVSLKILIPPVKAEP